MPHRIGDSLSSKATTEAGTAEAEILARAFWNGSRRGAFAFNLSGKSDLETHPFGNGIVGASGTWSYGFDPISADGDFEMIYVLEGSPEMNAETSVGVVEGLAYSPGGNDVKLPVNSTGTISFPIPGYATGGINGAYQVRIGFPAFYYTGNIGVIPPHSAKGVFLWGIGGLPGRIATDPLLPSETTPANTPGRGNIFGFDIPVIPDGYGSLDPVFIDPIYSEGYLYEVDGPNFASVLIPEPLPNGQSEFQLVAVGSTFDLTAGSTFDFMTYFSEGVSSFEIRGIRADEMLDPADPLAFVTGLTFVGSGIATVSMTSLTPIPEPTTLMLAAWTLIAAVVIRRSLRSPGAT